MTIDDFRSHVLDKIGSKGALDTGPVIGLTNNEAKAFSLSRAILAQANMDWSDAGFEKEVLRTTSRYSTRQNVFVHSTGGLLCAVSTFEAN